jgi:hypothetical protein
MNLVYESIENDRVICSIYENNGRYEAWVSSWKGTASTFDEAMEMAEIQINQTTLINVYVLGKYHDSTSKWFQHTLKRFLKKRNIKEYRLKWINLIQPEKVLYMGDREYAIVLQKHTPPIRIRGKNPELVVVVTY